MNAPATSEAVEAASDQADRTATAMAMATATARSWDVIARDTAPCNREHATRAVQQAYRAAGLEPPTVVWMDSPLGLVAAALALYDVSWPLTAAERRASRLWAAIEDRVQAQLGSWAWPDDPRKAPGAPVRDELVDGACGEARARVQAAVDPATWRRIERHSSLEVQIIARPMDRWRGWAHQVGGQLRSNLGDSLRQFRELAGASPLCVWENAVPLALATEGLRTNGLPVGGRVEAMTEALAAVGWWWATRDVAVLCDRPTVLHLDEFDHLHHDDPDQPALAWADGYCLYSQGGMTFPRMAALPDQV